MVVPFAKIFILVIASSTLCKQSEYRRIIIKKVFEAY